VKPRRADKVASSPDSELIARRGQFVRVAGEPAGFAIERDRDPKRIDHLWISVRAGRFGMLRITLNTSSLRNRDLGFDPRVYVGILESTWSQLPVADVVSSEPFDYAMIAAPYTLRFHEYERPALENLIAEKVARALFVEGWGELYVRGHSGIHQVHSRRASHAFKTDRIGRDGAVRFYFKEGNAEMLLFKFYGQP
jgi:hypothetical protein